MRAMRFNNAVQRVSVVSLGSAAGPTANPTITVAYRKPKKKRKKVSGPLTVPERLLRHMFTANRAVAQSFLDNHEKSSRKRKDGWAHDLGTNIVKAIGAGSPHLQVRKILPNAKLTPF
jgi:hypothetical protein